MRIDWRKAVMVALLAAIPLGGCTTGLKEQNALLVKENKELRGALDEQKASAQSLQSDMQRRDGEIANLQRELEDMRYRPQPVATVTEIVDPVNAFSGIEGVTGTIEGGEITATLESDVLFDPGKTALKANAKKALDAVAVVINNSYGGRSIKVSGHTDSDPIRKSGYKTNYHLAFERAYAVREYLISRGVPEKQVFLASFGPNDAKPTKARSRRVEIAVITGGT